MARATELAMENVRSGKGGPFAAVVVKEGRVVGEGTNAVTATNDPTAHAEIGAIREACKALGSFELSDCEIYANCEPCPMCLGAIYWARPARIYFAANSGDAAKIGFDDVFIYEQLKKTAKGRKIPMVQLMRADALKVFRVWESKLDKVKY
ncbi:MAG TPA: nucleoside deaminase [Candidatus Acidoferrales bacterium]|nr:nucleoside deaminase [Candidatus Acidoferrales bacterium]